MVSLLPFSCSTSENSIDNGWNKWVSCNMISLVYLFIIIVNMNVNVRMLLVRNNLKMLLDETVKDLSFHYVI